MDEFQTVVYSKQVIEFVAVAKEFCDFVETTTQMESVDFAERLQKFLPLIYLKGSMLPQCEGADDEYLEESVTESDYERVRMSVSRLMGAHDEYLEVFDDEMQYSAEPIVHLVSEGVADVYQDLKNFIMVYRCGLDDVMTEALWALNNNFELYWGKTVASLLRAVHLSVYKLKEEQEERR
ncbi:MAG: DUF5063 domain-containing protein [Marinifilaceae bacterium]